MAEFVHVYSEGGGIRNVSVGEGPTAVASNANLATELAAIGVSDSRYRPKAVLSDSKYSGVWTTSGTAGYSIAQSGIPGFSARLTTAVGVTTYMTAKRSIAPVVLGTNEVITATFYVEDPASTRNVRVTLAVDEGLANKAYMVCTRFTAGLNQISFTLADCIFSGTGGVSSLWSYLQIDVTGAAISRRTIVDIGEVFIGGTIKVPRVMIGFDSGYSAVGSVVYPAMKGNGLVGNVFAMPSSIGINGRMDLAMHKALYADGWDIGLYGNVDNMAANNHTVTGVALSQSVGVGASFILNGAYSSGGVATLSPPRVIVFGIASGTDETNGYTITGTDASGSALVDVVTGPIAGQRVAYSQHEFATITSIVSKNATAQPISVGTGFTAQEYLDQFALQKAWLDANGFTRGWAHYAYPWGQSNTLSEGWLRQAGFKTARTTVSGPSPFPNGNVASGANKYFLPCAVTLGDPGTSATIKAKIDLAILYGYDICIIGHVGGGVTPDYPELYATLAWLGEYHRSGKIKVLSFSQYEQDVGL